jgi:hypothetical protein
VSVGSGGGGCYAAGGAVSSSFWDGSGSAKAPDGNITFGFACGETSIACTGGGGGAGSAGAVSLYQEGANGGIGRQYDISGANVWYAAGGAGGAELTYNADKDAGYGANGGDDGAAHTGGGGSGGGPSTILSGSGGNGGSGIVIVRWPWTPTEGAGAPQ